MARALQGLEATLPIAGGRQFEAAGDVVALERRRNITLDTNLGPIDVVQRAPGVPSFADLDRRAVESDLLGVPVRVCALADLRQMKQARGSAQDRADLENLPRE